MGEPTRAAEHISIAPFWRCLVTHDKVKIPPRLVFGRETLFDGTLRIVKTQLSLLGLTLSKEQLPFKDVTSVHMRRRQTVGVMGAPSEIIDALVMTVANGKTLTIVETNAILDSNARRNHERLKRISGAIRKLITTRANYE